MPNLSQNEWLMVGAVIAAAVYFARQRIGAFLIGKPTANSPAPVVGGDPIFALFDQMVRNAERKRLETLRGQVVRAVEDWITPPGEPKEVVTQTRQATAKEGTDQVAPK